MFEPLQNNEPDCPSDAKRKPIAFSNRLRVCRPAGGFYARRVLKLGICSEKCNSELRTPCVLLLRLTCIFGCPGPEHDKGDTRSTESRTQFLHYRDNQAEETKESHPEKRYPSCTSCTNGKRKIKNRKKETHPKMVVVQVWDLKPGSVLPGESVCLCQTSPRPKK